MTGLDKMKSQILDEAKKAAEEKISEANAQADEMIRLAKEMRQSRQRASRKRQRKTWRIIRSAWCPRSTCRRGPRSWLQSRK